VGWWLRRKWASQRGFGEMFVVRCGSSPLVGLCCRDLFGCILLRSSLVVLFFLLWPAQLGALLIVCGVAQRAACIEQPASRGTVMD